MDILNTFESMPEQTVAVLHKLLGKKIFTDVNDTDEVEVGKVYIGERTFKVGDKFINIPVGKLKTKRVSTVVTRKEPTQIVSTIPVELIKHEDFNLSPSDFKVYLFIKVNKMLKGYREIEKQTGISLKTLTKILKSLEDKKLITTRLVNGTKFINLVEAV